MATSPVTLDFSKAQSVDGGDTGVSLDFSKAQTVDGAKTLDLSRLTPALRANYMRNASPTQFETDRAPRSRTAGEATMFGLKNIGEGIKQGAQGIVSAAKSAAEIAGGGGAQVAADAVQGAQDLGTQVAAVPGAVRDINQSTDPGAYYGDAAARTAGQGAGQAVTALATEGVAKAVPKAVSAARDVFPPIDKMIGVNPERLAELKEFPQKVTAVQDVVKAAEASAKAKAKAAFPKFDKPITLEPGEPAVDTGAIDANGQPIINGGKPAVTTTWDTLQEQRSTLLQKITREKVAVSRGSAPAFDLADMYDKLSDIDNTMTKAAAEQGGQAGLDQLQAARKEWKQYMDDFHNTKSPLRDILEAKPDETAKIVGKLTGRDSGPRALETLRRRGVDVSGAVDLLEQGKQPLAVNVTEAGKLRAAGSDAAYTKQRLNESIQQATNNRMPPRAEATIPSKNMSGKNYSVLGTDVPVSPRKITRIRLGRALKALDGSPTP